MQLGFDGVDLNFGCPDKSVVGRQGAGAALIGEPELAQRIVEATKLGAEEGARAAGLPYIPPVSVKTRIGLTKIVIDSWIQRLIVRRLQVTLAMHRGRPVHAALCHEPMA